MAKIKKIKGVFQKDNYWYARVDGKQVYCGKGNKGYNLAVAAKAKETARKYENKEINAGMKVKRAEFKTVDEMLKWYLELPTIKQQKIFSRKQSASVHLLSYFAKYSVNSVDGDSQENYREYRKSQGAADGTINIEIQLLSAAYHLAVKRKKIPADFMPTEFIKKLKINPRRIITEQEFNEILKYSNKDFQDFLICGYETAMRQREIRKLTASQVHLDERFYTGEILDYIDLGIFDTKTGARRTVPVSDKLKKILQRRLKGLSKEDKIFTHDGKAYKNTRRICRFLESACKKANVEYGDKVLNAKGERIGIVFHCLRHTRTTRWVEMGFSDEIIRRATGHRSLEAYQRYVKLSPAAVMRLVKNDFNFSKRDKNVLKSL
jgi:integrase